MRTPPRSARLSRHAFWLALAVAGMILVTRPWPGQLGRDQSAVPALLLVRFRLYGKVSVVY